MQLRQHVWALGCGRVSAPSPTMPNAGSRLVGASNLGRSFSVHESSIQDVLGGSTGPVSLSLPHMRGIVADVALSAR